MIRVRFQLRLRVSMLTAFTCSAIWSEPIEFCGHWLPEWPADRGHLPLLDWTHYGQNAIRLDEALVELV